MEVENLWGEIPQTGHVKTPITILREQAGLLSGATNMILVGDVGIKREGQNFILTLAIAAPALDNYRFAILQVRHDMTLYPLTVIDLQENARIQCNDESSYKSTLKRILSSSRIHQVIDSLLS